MTALELQGRARLVKVTNSKEGAGESKSLAQTFWLRLVTSADVCAFLGPKLRGFLFDKDTGEPSAENLKPLKWSGKVRNMEMDLHGVKFAAVELSDITVDAMPGERVALFFKATAFPIAGQIATTLNLLGDDIAIDLRPSSDLVDGPAPGQPLRTDAPAQGKQPAASPPANGSLPLQDAPQGGWPKAKRRGGAYELKGVDAEALRYHEGVTLCEVILLQVGPAEWVNGITLDLPHLERHEEPPAEMAKPFESRSAALVDAMHFVEGECKAWLDTKERKTHQRRPEVRALRDWCENHRDAPRAKPAAAAVKATKESEPTPKAPAVKTKKTRAHAKREKAK